MHHEEDGADSVAVGPRFSLVNAGNVAVSEGHAHDDLNQVPLCKETHSSREPFGLCFKELSSFLVLDVPSDVVAILVEAHDVEPLGHEEDESDVESPWNNNAASSITLGSFGKIG